MNSLFVRRLLRSSKLCAIKSTIGGLQIMTKIWFTTHQVTEKELPQYIENVAFKFNLRSFAVSMAILLGRLYRPVAS